MVSLCSPGMSSSHPRLRRPGAAAETATIHRPDNAGQVLSLGARVWAVALALPLLGVWFIQDRSKEGTTARRAERRPARLAKPKREIYVGWDVELEDAMEKTLRSPTTPAQRGSALIKSIKGVIREEIFRKYSTFPHSCGSIGCFAQIYTITELSAFPSPDHHEAKRAYARKRKDASETHNVCAHGSYPHFDFYHNPSTQSKLSLVYRTPCLSYQYHPLVFSCSRSQGPVWKFRTQAASRPT